MSRIDPEQPILASVLDRLLDDDPDALTDPTLSRGMHLVRLREALRRDIEALLNAHQYCRPVPRDLTELPASLLDYGLPHYLGMTAASESAREAFRSEVESILRRFEPRFKKVAVRLLENAETAERTLRFRIDALVHADPAPEPVSYNSRLDPTQQRFTVTSAARD